MLPWIAMLLLAATTAPPFDAARIAAPTKAPPGLTPALARAPSFVSPPKSSHADKIAALSRIPGLFERPGKVELDTTSAFSLRPRRLKVMGRGYVVPRKGELSLHIDLNPAGGDAAATGDSLVITHAAPLIELFLVTKPQKVYWSIASSPTNGLTRLRRSRSRAGPAGTSPRCTSTSRRESPDRARLLVRFG